MSRQNEREHTDRNFSVCGEEYGAQRWGRRRCLDNLPVDTIGKHARASLDWAAHEDVLPDLDCESLSSNVQVGPRQRPPKSLPSRPRRSTGPAHGTRHAHPATATQAATRGRLGTPACRRRGEATAEAWLHRGNLESWNSGSLAAHVAGFPGFQPARSSRGANRGDDRPHLRGGGRSRWRSGDLGT